MNAGNGAFGLSKTKILRGRREFGAVFEKGRFCGGSLVDLVWMSNRGEIKVAFAARKKVITACQRNRIKRRLREAFRHEQQCMLPGATIVFIGTEKILDTSVSMVRREMQRHLLRISSKLAGRG